MKLKSLVVLTALASTCSAFANIGFENDAELFLVVWNKNVGSYALDLGVSMNSLLDGSLAPFSMSVGPRYQTFLTAIGALINEPVGLDRGTLWAVFAADGEGLLNNDFRSVITMVNNVPFNLSTLSANDTRDFTQALSFYAQATANTGSHGVTGTTSVHGDSYNPLGTEAFFDQRSWTFANSNNWSGNAIGSVPINLISLSIPDIFAVVANSNPTGYSVRFDGQTVTVVPEPATVALILVGLAAVVGAARRRRA